MPIYQFECQKCQKVYEMHMSIKDETREFKCGEKVDDKPCLGTAKKVPARTSPPKLVGAGWTQKFHR
jgi:predicted nucleic acid-binding Zn ribbon protein